MIWLTYSWIALIVVAALLATGMKRRWFDIPETGLAGLPLALLTCAIAALGVLGFVVDAAMRIWGG